MKSILFSLIVFFVFFAQGRQGVLPYQQLCVQTLNTYGMFYADNPRERHEQTLKFLSQNDCDIILLQEVWESEHYRNLVQLSQNINMRSVYFRKSQDDRKSGLVGLFRGYVQNSDVIYFPSAERGLYELFKFLDKGFGVAQVNAPRLHQDSFLVFNFHLNHISQSERIRQLLLYLRWMLEASHQNQAVIAGGDFNFEPNSLEFRIVKKLLRFKDPYEQIGKDHECTHLCKDSGFDWLNFFLGESVRDYIFFRPSSEISFEPLDVSVFPKTYNNAALSDHFGLRAVFQLKTLSNRVNEREPAAAKVKDFENTLYEIESFFQDLDHSSSEINFVRSLRRDLTNSQSSIFQYLQ